MDVDNDILKVHLVVLALYVDSLFYDFIEKIHGEEFSDCLSDLSCGIFYFIGFLYICFIRKK